MFKYKKSYLVAAVLLILLAAILIFVNLSGGKTDHLIAKIRYLDGCTDTLSIKDYRVLENSILITKTDGRMILIGSNNVILIEDEEYWEESR